jgi:hypothetical protein
MIELIVLQFLENKLQLPVYMEAPKQTEDHVLIEKTGGHEENHICYATIAVQSVAKSLLEAAELNEKVKEAMREIEELDDVSQCTLNADYNFTDTTTKQYRYQAVFDLVHY